MFNYDLATRRYVNGEPNTCALVWDNRLFNILLLAQLIFRHHQTLNYEEVMRVLTSLSEVFVTILQEGHGLQLDGVFKMMLPNAVEGETPSIIEGEQLENRIVEASGIHQNDVSLILLTLKERLPELLEAGHVVQLDGVFDMCWRVRLEQHTKIPDEDDLLASFPYYAYGLADYHWAQVLLDTFNVNVPADVEINEYVKAIDDLHYSEVYFKPSIAYMPYPVPVWIEFMDAQEDSNVRYLDFGNSQFVDTALFQMLKSMDRVEEAELMFHWQVGTEIAVPKSDSAPQVTVEANETGYDLKLQVGIAETASPPVLPIQNLQISVKPDDQARYQLSATEVDAFVPLLSYFATQLQCGIWKQDGLIATLHKPKALLEPADISQHFVNILLSWGDEVIARAQHPTAEPPSPFTKPPVSSCMARVLAKTNQKDKAMNTNYLLPKFIRLRDAPFYLAMDKNRFNQDVRPTLMEIPIGEQGIAFERLDLDAWAEDYKSHQTRPNLAYPEKNLRQTTLRKHWDKRPRRSGKVLSQTH